MAPRLANGLENAKDDSWMWVLLKAVRLAVRLVYQTAVQSAVPKDGWVVQWVVLKVVQLVAP